MTRLSATHLLRASVARLAVGGGLAAGAALVVWFAGFNGFWAAATGLAVVPAGALLLSLGSADDAKWDPPRPPTPRGARLVMASMERALAACDRLARPEAVRHLRATVIAERDDQVDRSMVVRRMRALLVAELHLRRLDPANRAHDASVVSLFGPDALAILKPTDDRPVTTAVIARCLDAVAVHSTESPGVS